MSFNYSKALDFLLSIPKGGFMEISNPTESNPDNGFYKEMERIGFIKLFTTEEQGIIALSLTTKGEKVRMEVKG